MTREPAVVAVGLGPAGPEMRTEQANQLLRSGRRVYFRTIHHPGAVELAAEIGAASFDGVYEEADEFEGAYREIVDRLRREAEKYGTIVYAVPGSPHVAERTVELLAKDERISLQVVPSLSFCDLAWDRLGIDPLNLGVRLIDGTRFASEAADDCGPLLVAQTWNRAILSEIKLSVEVEAESLPPVTFLHHLGLEEERVEAVRWEDLDRSVEPDHLTSVWIPALREPIGREFVALGELVRTLRERCPWDREQNHHSLKRHLLEESYEVLDAIDRLPAGGGTTPEPTGLAFATPIADFEEELGDLLFQIFFHACLAGEEGWFTVADVARGVREKLIGRHPHVFGEVEAATAGAVVANWEQIKKKEKGRTSVLEGIPWALPALALAVKLQRKAKGVSGTPVLDPETVRRRIQETLASLPIGSGGSPAKLGPDQASLSEDLGSLLWLISDLARQCGTEPEEALRRTAIRFAESLQEHESSE